MVHRPGIVNQHVQPTKTGNQVSMAFAPSGKWLSRWMTVWRAAPRFNFSRQVSSAPFHPECRVADIKPASASISAVVLPIPESDAVTIRLASYLTS